MGIKRIVELFILLVIIVSSLNIFVFAEEYSNESVLVKPFIDMLENCTNGIKGSTNDKIMTFLNVYSEYRNRENLNRRISFSELIYENDQWLFRKAKSPDKNILKEISQRSGTYEMIGRLYIPDISLNTALFNTNSQEIVDAQDSAACFKSGDTFLVADHWYFGFDKIKDCKKGSVAYIDTGETVYEYVCTDVILGHNTGKILTDSKDNSLMYNVNTDGLTIYTCVNGWKNIRIAFFKPNNLYVSVDKLV